jgi:hypothetical protein
MALKSRGKYGASIGFSRRDLGGRIESGLFPVGARRGCLRRSFTMKSAKTELMVCKGGWGDVLSAAVHVGYDCSEIREQTW